MPELKAPELAAEHGTRTWESDTGVRHGSRARESDTGFREQKSNIRESGFKNCDWRIGSSKPVAGD